MSGFGISPPIDPSPIGGRVYRCGAGTANPVTNPITLPNTPDKPEEVCVVVDGVAYYEADGSFTLSGNQITWTNTVFSLAPSDGVRIYY